MSYTVSSARLTANADIIAEQAARVAGPLLVPWWPDGLRISITMGTVDTAQLEVAPGLDQGMDAGDTILLGTAVRTIASRATKFLTLVTLGGSVQEPANSWVYPMRRCILRDQGALVNVRHNSHDLRLRFEEL